MQDILELIEIARKKGQRSIQLVNQNFRKKEISKDNQLYEGLVNGEFTTDDEAAHKMFGADPGNRNFRNAKGKLRQKLLNHMYFLDYDKESYTLYEKQRYECMHMLHHCEILLHEGARDIAYRMLPTLIKIAQEFELVDVVIRAMTLLRNEYAEQGKTTLFSEVNQELATYREFQKVVEECEELYHQSLVYINKSLSAQQEVIDSIPLDIQRIFNFAKEHQSPYLDVIASRLSLIYNKLVWNFEDNISLCGTLEQKYLQGHNHEINVPIQKGEVAFEKMSAYLYLEQVKEGSIYAEEAWELYKNGQLDWFLFGELYFLLLMKGENFDDATEIYRKVRTNKNYGNLSEDDQERWQIYRAYLLFFNDTKLLRWGFDTDEFIANSPNYPRELTGYNIATLVVQFLYLFREGDVDAIRQKIEDIGQYNSVHLDKRHNYRNSIFIRLLSIIEQKNFDYQSVFEKGQNYLKKLRRTKIPVDRLMDMEVIPYEHLWLTVLDMLKTNKMYVHYRFYNTNSQVG
ncbi:MAG TPA: hypothetical protein DCE41_26335 [Cytophagales bacterium]|nr:hypothetical protein [Cytophagales bacterium]HAA23712.1 hypothetical protein [Cytophagales bacterium]HAP61254.1 hypothetical protein [Cytophagales bacterium]